MYSADELLRRVGDKIPRKYSRDKTRTLELGPAKQPRDAGFTSRPSSPNSILVNDADPDSDGDAESATPLADERTLEQRALLVVKDLRDGLHLLGCADAIPEQEMVGDFIRWFERWEKKAPSSSMDDAANSLFEKTKELFDEKGFGSMYQDPAQMMRLRDAFPGITIDTWPRSNNYGMVGSAEELTPLPASETDSMARNLGNGLRTDCLSSMYTKVLNATVQGVTITAGQAEDVLPMRALDCCPGHSTPKGAAEMKKDDDSLIEPDGLDNKIKAFAPSTFGSCLVKRGVKFVTRDDVLVARVCGAHATKAAKEYLESVGFAFIPVSDVLYNQLGIDANCARAVVGAKNGAPWGAFFAYKRGTMPLLVQCLPQAGSCAAGPNARYWGGATGVGLIYLTNANFERRLAGEPIIKYEDSLFVDLGFNPGKAHERAARMADGVVPWVTPCVRGGLRGGFVAGELLRESWIAYRAGEATPDHMKRLKASEGWRLHRAWIAYYAGKATPDEIKLVDANREHLANCRDIMQQARDAYDAGIADDKQASAVERQDAGLADGRDTMNAARDANNAGVADANQAGSVKRQDAGLADGRNTMHQARDANNAGVADAKQASAVERQAAGRAEAVKTMNAARAASKTGKLDADQAAMLQRLTAGRDPSLTAAQKKQLKVENARAKARRCREKKKAAKVASAVNASSAAPQVVPSALAELDACEDTAPSAPTVQPAMTGVHAATASVQAEQPALSQPALSQPKIPQPEIPQPAVSQPALSQPKIPQPEIPQPAVAPPAVAQPEVAQPAVAQPVVTQPTVAPPVVSQPTTAALDPLTMNRTQCETELKRLQAFHLQRPKPCGKMSLAEIRQHLVKTLALKVRSVMGFFTNVTK